MEKKLRNKRIRLIAIVLIVLMGIGFTVSRLQVEPADYRASLEKRLAEAEELLEKAEIGNGKGQYSADTAKLFEEQIQEARRVAEDEQSYYELLKGAYETLGQYMNGFKNNKNQVALDEGKDGTGLADVGHKSGETGQPGDDSPSGDKSHTANDGSNGTGNGSGTGSSGSGTGGNGTGSGGAGTGGNGTGSSGTGNESSGSTEEEDMVTVYISIDCYTLMGDGLSNLVDENLVKYVPSDGVILKRTAYQCKRGTSVYEVLYNVCRNKGIQMEASYTPLYSGYYVEGINYLYEFHGGSFSGWLYRVNDIFPNYGCSRYFLEEGDEIIWSYTCTEGDVPGTWM